MLKIWASLLVKNIGKHLSVKCTKKSFWSCFKKEKKKQFKKLQKQLEDFIGNEIADKNIGATSGSGSETASSKTKDIESDTEQLIEMPK